MQKLLEDPRQADQRHNTVLQKAPQSMQYKSSAQFLQYFKDGYSSRYVLMFCLFGFF